MEDSIVRFDMKKLPIRQRRVLQPITWLLSYPDVWLHRAKITKIGCEGLKPPFIFLGNHNAFFDFKVATAALFPWRANYVVAIDGFIGREWLLRNAGGICKRKFTSDVQLVRQIKRVLDNGDIILIYPESRYSLCGTTALLPDSLGKMCKMMGVPVVTIITHGHHVDAPFWNLKKRKVKGTEAVMKQLFSAEQLEGASVAEINEAIRAEFRYDDFAWQRERKIKISVPWRAEGLHKVLYKCAHCGTEYRMKSRGKELSCAVCGKRWEMTELGELAAENGETEFSHIPDWYEWERAEVRREVEAGTYRFSAACHVDSLPNAKGYIKLGEGRITHDMDGFRLEGTGPDGSAFGMVKTVPSLYSCHIEYEYLGKYGDCIDLNTPEDTYYIYPHGEDFSVTKIALATEELYLYHRRMAQKE
jgi:1-acyl-sn-glycerol-3-phosphate acyltransferase/transcription elongation factor Elf1